MTSILRLEQALTARIAAALTPPGKAHPAVEVRAWPDRASEFRSAHALGTALVLYRGTQFTHQATASQPVMFQEQFDIALLARTLREPSAGVLGVYELVDTCRRALMGWTPETAAGPVQMLGVEFVEYAEGAWQFALRVSVPMIDVADRPRPPGPWAVADEDVAPALRAPNFQQ